MSFDFGDARLPERFWVKVSIAESGCWLWTGSKTKLVPGRGGGYGRVRRPNGKRTDAPVMAHRVFYEAAHGPVPEGEEVDHVCHEPSCVNPGPRHLRSGTHKQNQENLSGAHYVSKSGVRGVFWHIRIKKWQAQVRHNKRTYHVGYFDDLAEAERQVIAKRNELYTRNDQDRAAA